MKLEVPKGWTVKKISEIGHLNSKMLTENTDKDYSFFYIDLSSVDKGKIIFPQEKTIFSEASSRARKIFKRHDILMSTVRPYLQAFAFIDFTPRDCIASTGFAVISIENEYDARFIYQTLYSHYLLKQMHSKLVGSNYPALNTSDVKSLWVLFPNNPLERKKIAEILSTWDEAIEKTEKLIDLKKKLKKGLMQQLLTGKKRFKEFEGEEWEKNEFDKIFIVDNDKSKQIKKVEYQKSGKYPVVDQGKEFIAGYTDKNNLYSNVPVIIFGDHTREIKWIDFPFAIGADGTQILKTTEKLHAKFGYYLLSFIKLPNLGYSRHMRELKQQIFKYPVSMDYQRRIASVLSAADREIELLNKKLEVLKEQKRGLMQVLLTGRIRVNG